jgi:hypothetical protein
MTDRIIDLVMERERRRRSTAVPAQNDEKAHQTAIDIQAQTEYSKQLKSLYKEQLNDKEAESLSKLLVFFVKRIKSVMKKIHSVAKEDPRFGLAMATVLNELASDELLRIGLCGAVEKEVFDKYLGAMIEELGKIEYFEDFECLCETLEDFEDEDE